MTINRGTEGGGMLTRMGNDNLLMAYVHVGTRLPGGSHTILANAATLAGHVQVEDGATLAHFAVFTSSAASALEPLSVAIR